MLNIVSIFIPFQEVNPFAVDRSQHKQIAITV